MFPIVWRNPTWSFEVRCAECGLLGVYERSEMADLRIAEHRGTHMAIEDFLAQVA